MTIESSLDKASKAKTLATASTLQKVVCPAPERDPQEILSNGWRKVGEQKRYTNRLANGHPDLGVGIPSREGSFSDAANQAKRPNGRQVLDNMFGHMRPHHNLVPTAVLRPDEQTELENGLGTQAARAAFYRPAIAPSLAALPSDAQITEGGAALVQHPQLLQATAAGRGPGYGSGSEWSEVEAGGGEEDEGTTGAGGGDMRTSSSSAPGSGASPRNSRYRRPAPGTTLPPGATPVPPAQPPARRAGSLPRGGSLTRTGSLNTVNAAAAGGASPGSGGGSGGCHRGSVLGAGHGSTPDRRAALPSVARSYPSDNTATNPHAADAPRLPAAAAGPAGVPHGKRRASVSGDMALPVISPTGAAGSGGGGSPAAAAAGVSSGGKPAGAGGRARRASQVGLGADGVVSGSGAQPHVLPTAALAGGRGSHSSVPVYSGGSVTMPYILARGSNGGGGGGVSGGGGGSGGIGGGEGGTGRWSDRGSGGGSPPVDVHVSTTTTTTSNATITTTTTTTAVPTAAPSAAALAAALGGPWAPTWSSASVTHPSGGPLLRWSNNGSPTPATTAAVEAASAGIAGPAAGGSQGAVSTAVAHVGLLAQLGDLHHPGGGAGGGSGPASGGGAATSPAVPLSGLDNLSTTGLGDAISQLRHIRMGGSGGGAVVAAAAAKERKPELGLAGVIPLQLLPVSLPPVDSWQAGGKQAPELDPCRGIRLVDTANYVLPRPTAEVFLQVKMAHHQAAMRDLVKAEGAPMSEMEMEAVKLLGRLERSGARHRNFDDCSDGGDLPAVEVARG